MAVHSSQTSESATDEVPRAADRTRLAIRGRSRGGGTLALLCVSMFIVYLDTTITPVALPAVRAELGAGVAGSQWVLDAYVLAFACLLLTSGSLGDILGRKRVFLVGMIGFVVASVGCALAQSIGELIAARAVQGVFAAVVVPTSLALTGDLYTDSKARARAVGIWGGTGGVALAVGPIAGGVLAQRYGWPSIFWINLPIGAMVTIALARLLVSSPRRPDRRLDRLGQVLFVIGTAALTYGLIEGNAYGWSSVPIVSAFVVAIVALCGFGIWETRCAHPMLPAALVRVPVVLAACAVNFLGMFGMYAALFLLTFYLQQQRHLTPIATGTRFLAMTVAIAVSALVAPTLASRIGTRTTMIIGALLTTIGLAGFVLVRQDTSFATYVWALILLGLGIPLSAGVVAIAAVLAAVPSDIAGTVSSTVHTFRQIGAVFGVALAGLFVSVSDPIKGMHITFAIAAIGAMLGAIAVFLALRPAVQSVT